MTCISIHLFCACIKLHVRTVLGEGKGAPHFSGVPLCLVVSRLFARIPVLSLFQTGGKDRAVNVWDIRQPIAPVETHVERGGSISTFFSRTFFKSAFYFHWFTGPTCILIHLYVRENVLTFLGRDGVFKTSNIFWKLDLRLQSYLPRKLPTFSQRR